MNIENVPLWGWYGLLLLMVAVPVGIRLRTLVKLNGKDQLLEMKASWMSEAIEIVYPGEARRRGLEGTVTVEVEFDESGKAIGKKVIQSSNIEDLDLSALEAVSKSKLAPDKELIQQLKVTFKLKNA